MRIDEFTDEPIYEARMVWRKVGNKIKRAVRCTAGRRKGRVVSNPSQCNAPIDYKKRIALKRTKARLGARMSKKARRTKRYNSLSKRVAKLNRR
tara:strand:+ start:255 stop:536 length:282 start_codon:yes stop_codon:yes gene_type:complete